MAWVEPRVENRQELISFRGEVRERLDYAANVWSAITCCETEQEYILRKNCFPHHTLMFLESQSVAQLTLTASPTLKAGIQSVKGGKLK
jgi:hypothetical protein